MRYYDDNTQRYEYTTESYYGDNTIIDEEFVIKIFEEGQVRKGVHSIPFKIILNGNLPSSILYDNNGSHAVVKYSISARMKANSGLGLKDLEHTLPLSLKQHTLALES